LLGGRKPREVLVQNPAVGLTRFGTQVGL
jgi:hypothetical protein